MLSYPLARVGAWLLGAASLLSLAACHDVRLTSKSAGAGIGIYDDLYAVSAVDANTIVAGGYYGTIYRSLDGGESWVKAPTGTHRSVYDIAMASAQVGWAVGQSGLILRTTDGGASWQSQPNVKEQEGAQLFAVFAIDGNTAWAVGEWGSRIFTDDGGATWQDFSLLITESHPQFVWLAPPDQARVRSGQKVYEDVSLNDVVCAPAPSQNCWVAGEFGYIFYSTTAGREWIRGSIVGDIEPQPVPVAYNETDISDDAIEQLRAFAKRIEGESHLNVEIEPMASAREMAEFGKLDDPTPLFEILDARKTAVRGVIEEAGILSDRIRERGAPPWDYLDFLKDDPGFLKRYLEGRVAASPMIQVRVAQNPYLFSVDFADLQHGYIAALGGLVLRTENGGQTWTYQRTARRQALFGIGLGKSRQIAVGEKGFIQLSTNGGQSWETPKSGFPPIFLFMRDIAFTPDKAAGFIVGQSGTVLRTTDDGASWSQVLPKTQITASVAGD